MLGQFYVFLIVKTSRVTREWQLEYMAIFRKQRVRLNSVRELAYKIHIKIQYNYKSGKL